MFAIIYKQDSVPMCARLRADGPDAVVFWPSEEKAHSFLTAKGDEYVSSYAVLRIDDDGLHTMAQALGMKDEEIELIPFPA